MHSTALDYARFLRAVYDLHRLELYKALSFEGPPDLSRETEKLHGQVLLAVHARRTVGEPRMGFGVSDEVINRLDRRFA